MIPINKFDAVLIIFLLASCFIPGMFFIATSLHWIAAIFPLYGLIYGAKIVYLASDYNNESKG